MVNQFDNEFFYYAKHKFFGDFSVESMFFAGVLSIDDDLLLSPSSIHLAFNAWKVST